MVKFMTMHVVRAILGLVGMTALVLGMAEDTTISWTLTNWSICVLCFWAIGKWFITDEEKEEEV